MVNLANISSYIAIIHFITLNSYLNTPHKVVVVREDWMPSIRTGHLVRVCRTAQKMILMVAHFPRSVSITEMITRIRSLED